MRKRALTGEEFARLIVAGAERLESERETVDSMNVFPVPDGDTGTNMHLTVTAAVREVLGTSRETVGQVAKAAARGSMMGARGNSGVILSQIFRGLAQPLRDKQVADAKAVASALRGASDTAYGAVMRPVEGTILSVCRAMAEGASSAMERTDDVIHVLEAAVAAGRRMLERTPEMLPELKQAGVVDAGGMGLLVLMEGALAYLKGEHEPSLRVVASNQEVASEGPKRAEQVIKLADIRYPYCTEVSIAGTSIGMEELRERLSALGDSLLVVGEGDLVKVHVHTSNPGRVLEICGQNGEMFDIKINNMRRQNAEAAARGSRDQGVRDEPAAAGSGEPAVRGDEEGAEDCPDVALVAVSPGEGITRIFQSLGVHAVVNGGQTMNPSIEEIKKAIDKTRARSVIILPNNKNIIFAAQQVRNLAQSDVRVIATRNVPQGIEAAMGFDPSRSLEENAEMMEAAAKSVSSIEITYAVRNSRAGDIEISARDYVGVYNGRIVTAGPSLQEVAMNVLGRAATAEEGLITVYHGRDVANEDAQEFAERLQKQFPTYEVEVYEGGQPHYYYIMSVQSLQSTGYVPGVGQRQGE